MESNLTLLIEQEVAKDQRAQNLLKAIKVSEEKIAEYEEMYKARMSYMRRGLLNLVDARRNRVQQIARKFLDARRAELGINKKRTDIIE
jgi:hypothetical protein